MPDTNTILTKARALIERPQAWSGPPDHESEGLYCAATAIWQAARSDEVGAISSPESIPAGWALAHAAELDSDDGEPWHAIYDWNDYTTHDVVLAAFDRAIQETR